MASLTDYKAAYTLKYYYKYLIPLVLYFIYLTIISILNQTLGHNNFFDFYLFMDILTFTLFINYSRKMPSLLLKSLFVFSISSFVLAILFYLGISGYESADLARRYSVFGINMNVLGLKMCFSLLILITIVFDNNLKLHKIRYVLIIIFPFLLFLLLQTASRVAILSLALGLVVFMFYNKYSNRIQKILLTVLLLSFLGVFWQVVLKNSFVVERIFETIYKGDLSNRDFIWVQVLDIISDNYIFGIGKTGYELRLGSTSPHNVILEVLSYTGIIGFLLFSYFIYTVVRQALKKTQNNDKLSIMLLVPIFGMILSGQIFGQKIVWFIFAYIVSREHLKSNIATIPD